ncbi:MAG TPA: DUF3455 domain-containing protein [Chitinophagaceae bacterium]|nr:DUF3455 domain-containing protein [Chitinophagaceae bacterium]
MSRLIVSISFMAVISVVLLLSSCKKEKVEDTNSPAFHIAESEKLVIPDAIKLPDNMPNGNSRVAAFFADGVQKYKAQEVPGSNPVTYQWVFVAPQADLYDATNKKVGTHSAGPTWQLSIVDSMYGQAFSPPRAAPGNDASSIDWLLLMPKINKPPTGIFANVSYVQRVDTKGGKAPATPPGSATETADVHYTAIYRFSKINP